MVCSFKFNAVQTSLPCSQICLYTNPYIPEYTHIICLSLCPYNVSPPSITLLPLHLSFSQSSLVQYKARTVMERGRTFFFFFWFRGSKQNDFRCCLCNTVYDKNRVCMRNTPSFPPLLSPPPSFPLFLPSSLFPPTFPSLPLFCTLLISKT